MAAVAVDERAAWIVGDPIRNEAILRIYKFFVLNSPVDGLSSRQKNLLNYGWTSPWRKPYSLRKKLNGLTTSKEFLFSAQSYETMDEALAKANLSVFPPQDFSERACVYNAKKTQYLSLFYHIRNGFAHGRYNTIDDGEDVIFVMEDVVGKRKGMLDNQKTCSARIIVRLSTMIRWIELIEGGETT